MKTTSVRPIPDGKGLGFFSNEEVDAKSGHEGSIYLHVPVNLSGRVIHNYHFTNDAWRWPFPFAEVEEVKTVDGFSPNLNKELHIGHLRNLAIANAFSKLYPRWKFVAILGVSLGCLKGAKEHLEEWFNFVNYHPTIYYDCIMPQDVVKRQPGTGKNEGAQVWVNEHGKELIVMRSNLYEYICRSKIGEDDCDFSFYLKTEPAEDATIHCPRCGQTNIIKGKSVVPGKPNYVLHDLSFAKTVGPDYYITGAEQVEHFRDLGLGNRHLPMGLVCGKDGKKLKSRTGDAMSAVEAIELIKSRLDKTPEPDKLAWNIICWNFLHVNREQNVKFDPEGWTDPNSPGLYVSYTYARLFSAVEKAGLRGDSEPHAQDRTELDLKVLAYSQYSDFYLARAVESQDTAIFANYIHDFCRVLGEAYNNKDGKIMDGRPAFQYAIKYALFKLRICMDRLGMFPLQTV